MRVRDILLALLAMALWGLNFSVAKIALGTFPPFLTAALRFTLVALLLVPLRPRLPNWRGVLVLAMTLGLAHYPLAFAGLRLLDASTAAIILQLQVPFGVLAAALFLGERLRWREAVGILIAFAGVALIAGAPRLSGSHAGIAILLVAATGWGVATVQLKRLGKIDPLTLNGWLGLFIAIELWVLSRAIEGPPAPYIAAAGWLAWSSVAYTAILSTIVAYGLWAYLVNRYTVGQTMPFMLTVPLFAILGGVAINGDRVTLDIVLGGVCTLGGVGLIALRPFAKALSPAAAAS
jgi:O-acetylserine/cysteine efflux transporter